MLTFHCPLCVVQLCEFEQVDVITVSYKNAISIAMCALAPRTLHVQFIRGSFLDITWPLLMEA